MAWVANKAVADVQLSTTVSPRQPSSPLLRRMVLPRMGRQLARPPQRASSRLVKTAEPLSRPCGDETKLDTLYAMHAVCVPNEKRLSNVLTRSRSLLQASRRASARRNEEAGDQASETHSACRSQQQHPSSVFHCQLLATDACNRDSYLRALCIPRPIHYPRIQRGLHPSTQGTGRCRLHQLPQQPIASRRVSTACGLS